MTADKFLSTEEATKFLSLSRQGFVKLANRQKFRRFKRDQSRKYYFLKQELIDFQNRGFKEVTNEQ